MKKIYPIFRFIILGILVCIAFGIKTQPIMVINTADSGPGSLRDAINIANSLAGHDLIHFNIPSGPFVIFPLSQLPQLTDPAGVTIDGFTQTGSSIGSNPPVSATIIIELDGSLMPGPPAPGPLFTGHGLWIISSNNLIQGLVIRQFQNDGIRIEGGYIENQPALDNTVYCNFIGTDQSGTMIGYGNGTDQSGNLWAGVKIQNNMNHGNVAMDNVINANVISNNWSEGVWIQGPFQIPGDPIDDVAFNSVLNNHVGVDISGSKDLGNIRVGVELSEGTHDNTIQSNVISGNGWDGVGIQGFNNIPYLAPAIYTQFNWVDNNIIGMDINANSPIPNDNHGVAIGIYGPTGICWGYAYDNQITNNVIAHNGNPAQGTGDGVAICEDHTQADGTAPFNNADENTISKNAIYNNVHLGIDLDDNDGVTPNDVGDPDNSSNENLNFPVITSVNNVAGNTIISGVIDLPGTVSSCTIEVFESDFDPSLHGEGMNFLGSTTINIPPSVFPHPWSVTTPLTVWPEITSNATDNQGNTSEFSLNASNIVIPLQLISFEAKAENDHILLAWRTQNELNIRNYGIQRAKSIDKFSTIKKIKSKTDIYNYSYSDNTVLANELYYYRLKITEQNGAFWYSQIKTALINDFPQMKVFPNPFTNALNIHFPEKMDSEFQIEIYTSSGILIYTHTFEDNNLARQYNLELPKLSQGVYTLKINTAQKIYHRKLVRSTY
jgi:hypothetical protein